MWITVTAYTIILIVAIVIGGIAVLADPFWGTLHLLIGACLATLVFVTSDRARRWAGWVDNQIDDEAALSRAKEAIESGRAKLQDIIT